MSHKDPVRRKAYHAAWYSRHKDEIVARTRAWRKTNPEGYKDQQRHADYGITRAEYDAMFAEQGGRCAVCGYDRPLVVDHNHATGKVRGLLCRQCNTALGFLDERGASVYGLVAYIDRHRVLA